MIVGRIFQTLGPSRYVTWRSNDLRAELELTRKKVAISYNISSNYLFMGSNSNLVNSRNPDGRSEAYGLNASEIGVFELSSSEQAVETEIQETGVFLSCLMSGRGLGEIFGDPTLVSEEDLVQFSTALLDFRGNVDTMYCKYPS